MIEITYEEEQILDNIQFDLSKGEYEISFNANATSEIGDIGIALFNNDIQINGTEIDCTIREKGEWHNISFNKKIIVYSKETLEIKSVHTTSFNGIVSETEIPILKNINILVKKKGD